MSISPMSCDVERMEVSVSECRKLEVYYQCNVTNLNIMEDDKRVDLRLNIPRQPNDVRIESSSMHFIPKQLFEGLVDLKEFVAINCSIRNIFYDTFTSAFKLHYLVLSHNNIVFIADNAFRNASDLQSLKLDNNELEMLTTNVFRGLNMLRTLKLSFNRLAYLPLYLFHDLENLEFLELDHNRLRVMSAEQFAGNPLLQEIDLASNRISIIDNGTFDGLTNVQQLQLENNVCVNEKIGQVRGNATISGMLPCCVASLEEMRARACLTANRAAASEEGGDSILSVPLAAILFVSIIGNMILVTYLLNNRAWLERFRNREEAIELVNANSYQIFCD
jgi:hypothetical protein